MPPSLIIGVVEFSKNSLKLGRVLLFIRVGFFIHKLFGGWLADRSAAGHTRRNDGWMGRANTMTNNRVTHRKQIYLFGLPIQLSGHRVYPENS